MVSAAKTGKFSFLDTVLRVAEVVKKGRRRRAQALKLVADKKFSELEKTHKLFIRLLGKLADAAQSVSARMDTTDDIYSVRKSFEDAIVEIENLREKGRDSRISHFSEAIAYSQRAIEDQGIFLMVDQTAAEMLKELMRSYMDYFRVDNAYLHELGFALSRTHSSLVAYRIAQRNFDFKKIDLKRAATETEKVARSSIESSREKWKAVTLKYHQLNFYLLEKDLG